MVSGDGNPSKLTQGIGREVEFIGVTGWWLNFFLLFDVVVENSGTVGILFS